MRLDIQEAFIVPISLNLLVRQPLKLSEVFPCISRRERSAWYSGRRSNLRAFLYIDKDRLDFDCSARATDRFLTFGYVALDSLPSSRGNDGSDRRHL
jgi:hypothetical protein